MAKIFKDNEELNNIVNIFYEKADEEKIEDIDAYLSDIESNILLDFDVINSMCKRKNSKISSKLIVGAVTTSFDMTPFELLDNVSLVVSFNST